MNLHVVRPLAASGNEKAAESNGPLTIGLLPRNGEIAQALFLTENQIETHLRSIFRKLEIRARSQLARAL